MDELYDFFAIMSGAVVVMVIFYGMGEKFTRDEMEKEIIQHGYGLYCPDTAKFAFNGECDKIAK
jgi:hypothetical protein